MAPNQCKKLVLSRYFNDNTYLIAGICSKCYDELEDVKITGVNKTFLKQFENKREFRFPNENDDFFLELDVDITNFKETEINRFGLSQNVGKHEEGSLENIFGCFSIKSDSFEQDQIHFGENITESREGSMKGNFDDIFSLRDNLSCFQNVTESLVVEVQTNRVGVEQNVVKNEDSPIKKRSENSPIKSPNFCQDQISFFENKDVANQNQTHNQNLIAIAFLDCDHEKLDQIGVDQNDARKQNGDEFEENHDDVSNLLVSNILSTSAVICDNNEKKEIDFLGFGPKDISTLKNKLDKTVQKLESSWEKFYLNNVVKEEPKDQLCNENEDDINENVEQGELKYSKFFMNKIEAIKSDQNVLVNNSEKKPCLSQLLDNNFKSKGSNSKEIVKNEVETEDEVLKPMFFNWPTSKNNFLVEPIWHPPKSPHNLIEESLYHDPWALLVATIFLNKTSAKHARPYIADFLKDYTNPFEVIKSSVCDLERYFEKIGLKKRSVQVWRMSYDFVYKNWRDVQELYGVGKYGRDAFNMFCLGNFDVQPKDRYLKIYKAWYQMVYLRKDVDFNQNFMEAFSYKNDEWCFSDDSSDQDGDIAEIT